MEISLLELKKLSLQFRQVSSRLIRSDYDEAMVNLRRLMNFIDSEPLIANFIAERQQTVYDMETIVSDRNWRETFDVPADVNDEIAFTYQLLTYALDHLNDYQRLCFGYSTGSRVRDWISAFHSSVVSPFIGHISTYLNGLMLDAGAEESSTITVSVSGTGNQVTLGQGNAVVRAYNQTSTNSDGVTNVIKALDKFLEILEQSGLPHAHKQELRETAETLQEEIQKKEPKKGLVRSIGRALKSLAETAATAVKVTDDVKEIVTDATEIADHVSDIFPL